MTQELPPELESRPQSRREWSGWLTSLVLPLSFVIVLVGGLLVLQNARTGNSNASPYGIVALPDENNATDKPPRAEVGRAAPDFVLESAAGGPLYHLSEIQGGPVLLTFFTTWCIECRTQSPLLIEAAATPGLTVLLINLRESNDRVEIFMKDYSIDFPVLLDRDGDVSGTWLVGGRGQPLPASFFLDETGVIRKVVGGPLTPTLLEEGLNSIIKGRQN